MSTNSNITESIQAGITEKNLRSVMMDKEYSNRKVMANKDKNTD